MIKTVFGKYRAVVVKIDDPEKSGRIRVLCPELLGDNISGWCLPCVPVSGDEFGDFCLPILGESVWIEFEKGNINSPVYSGGWYSPEKTPAGLYNPTVPQRVISFGNVKFVFTNGNLQLQVGESVINFDPTLIERLASAEPATPEGATYFLVQEEEEA